MRTPVRLIAATLLWAFAQVATAVTIDPNKWQLVDSEPASSLKTYQQYDEKTGLVALKFEGNVNFDFEHVVSLIFEQRDRRCTWTEYCESITLLEEGPGYSVEQVVLETIMGVVDQRTFVSRTVLNIDAASKKRRVSADTKFTTSAKARKSDDWILGKVLHSRVDVKERQKSQTFVSWEIMIDPAGLLPTWVVNMTAKPWPRETFNKLNRELAKGPKTQSKLLQKATKLAH